MNLFTDIESKIYDGTVESRNQIAHWFFKLAMTGEFAIHPSQNGVLKIHRGAEIVLTPLGLEVRFDYFPKGHRTE